MTGGVDDGEVNEQSAPPRLVGVDVARGLALVGMMATHVVPAVVVTSSGPAGALVQQVHPLHLVAGGRSSALFAVLAGVALALVAGRAEPPSGAALGRAVRALLARALVVAAVGLTLGSLDSGIAVILVNYAALFVVACTFLALRARWLWPLAVAWLLLSPVVGHLWRERLPPGPGSVPSWTGLVDPAGFLTELVVTGYYPVLQWTGYVLLGLAVGRSGWLHAGRPRPLVALTVGGAAVAVLAKLVSSALLSLPGVRERLVVPPTSFISADLDLAVQTSMYGTTPTTSWWWLAVSGSHSGTPLDLLHTAGCALAVLGLCLLLTRSAAARAALLPLAAAGSMTFTLYTLHVLVETVRNAAAPAETAGAAVTVWLVQVVLALAVATAWRLLGRGDPTAPGPRGPLESVAAAASRAAAGPPAGGAPVRR